MKILIVDDEELLVKGIRFNLQNDGYEVEEVHQYFKGICYGCYCDFNVACNFDFCV